MKRLVPGVVIASLAVSTWMQAAALEIVFEPVVVQGTIGDTLRIDILLLDYEPGTSPVIGDFDLLIRFDPDKVASAIEHLPTATVFGGELLGVSGTQTTAVWGVNTWGPQDLVGIREYSVLTGSTLAAIQTATRYRLGSLYFEALAAGTVELAFDTTSLGGAPLFVSGVYDSVGPRLSASPGGATMLTIIPEPATITLLLAVLLLALWVRRHPCPTKASRGDGGVGCVRL